MRRSKSQTRSLRKQRHLSESAEIELLESWIESQKPHSGTNPLSVDPPPTDRASAASASASGGDLRAYAGVKLFSDLPISKKTKDGLARKRYVEMSDIQRASLPHSLCGRDILGAAKTGSGKTLAFVIPVIEKLYRARWGPEDGVGSIIISPTKELAGQLFEELKIVGKYHGLSAGLLIGGRKDVDAEKECVNALNVLVCTPGRLLQHMNETPNFECSQLQVLVLDEADRILDAGFKKELDAIISQLPRQRQTLLFSATQTKSVKDLARLSLKDPEYISVHAESKFATPEKLKQIAMEVPLDQKLNMLWSFIRSHLHSKILVFLSSCKQVKFVYEAFKKLRPGIPLKCLHGRMKQDVRMAVYLQFCEKTSVLFSTDVASRGLDFPAVDWVIQVDCPEDIACYIHRVGRTARFTSEGKSVLFLAPSEKEMLIKLQAAEPRIPVQLRKPDAKKMEQISGSLASLLVKYPNMQQLAKRAFITYLKSIHLQKDKEVFDLSKLPIEEFAGSLGLPMTPKVRFISQKKSKKGSVEATHQQENDLEDGLEVVHRKVDDIGSSKDEEEDNILFPKETSVEVEANGTAVLATRVLKKKKLKINVHRPVGTRVKYDDDGNAIAPLAAFGDSEGGNGELQPEKVKERYEKLREEMKVRDEEDKVLHRKRMREKRTKEKLKMKRSREEETDTEDDHSELDEETQKENSKRSKKIHYDSDNDEGDKKRIKDLGSVADSVSIAEQEALALKLLSSMHS
ncbi:DEAD-box ATP-dependent RNA helicase 32 isoform X2 [Iris pallida]|uniref:ATP-dependent RNA helicase n=1 Tax=Iris pallida TaxID=29817 RepID=A0AAX6E0R3_IRIPA|nr:DEAD-box ATP-dependent RNA helicase 32 isoform X2 [Iris pallida]